MLFFVNDYGEGAHPKVIDALVRYNMSQQLGYGDDAFTLSARRKIAEKCGVPAEDVHLLTGGTQTNATVLDSMLRSYEGVIAAKTGHINSHESGAVEAFGHKVIPIDAPDGKLNAEALDAFLRDTFESPTVEHAVIPGGVYISFPTEYGTLYSKRELEELYIVCRRHGVFLYIDGARLGYALASSRNDMTVEDVVRLCDAFYIGGTKVGALCGEAVVFTKRNTPAHFTAIVKRHGALLAKGRLLGIQFDALFTDDLYFEIGRNAIETASRLRSALMEKGYRLFIDSPTNQLFPIVSRDKIRELSDRVGFEFWEKYDDDHDVIRFVTSWATKPETVEELISLL